MFIRDLEHLTHLCQRFPIQEEGEEWVHPRGMRKETHGVSPWRVELGM